MESLNVETILLTTKTRTWVYQNQFLFEYQSLMNEYYIQWKSEHHNENHQREKIQINVISNLIRVEIS